MGGHSGESAESSVVTEFLAAAATHPSALIIEGEAGIGKTTLWLDALTQAQQQGFRILSARAGQAESGLAYAALADLLADVAPVELDGLPFLQRVALDRVLLQRDGAGPTTDQRVAAAAFLTVVDQLSAATPIVIAVDDVQWLDASSRTVVAFAARRLKGRIGVLVSERTEADTGNGAPWLELTRLDGVQRVRVSPLGLGGLRSMIARRLGRALPRPTIVRIGELSGGNPFYALELARAMDTSSPTFDAALPDSLSDLVRSRLDQLGDETLTVLLAAACLGATTVDLLAGVTGESAERIVDLLEVPESNGIVQIEGKRVQFTHPLLARGVYTVVGPARRRQMHRTLGDFVDQPELRARHLALAASTADAATLLALDAASARARGAPAAAAGHLARRRPESARGHSDLRRQPGRSRRALRRGSERGRRRPRPHRVESAVVVACAAVLGPDGRFRSPRRRGAGASSRSVRPGTDQPGTRDVGAGDVHARRRCRRTESAARARVGGPRRRSPVCQCHSSGRARNCCSGSCNAATG